MVGDGQQVVVLSALQIEDAKHSSAPVAVTMAITDSFRFISTRKWSTIPALGVSSSLA